MKVVVIHEFWIVEEALAILNKVAQVAYPLDPLDEALRAAGSSW